MKFKTILFDLDGTLLNTLDDLTESVNHILEIHGHPLRKKTEIRRFLGGGARNLITRSLPEGTDEATVNARLEEYLPWYSAHSEIATAPYEGILQLLDELQKKGVQIAVVSNKGEQHVKPLVRKYFPQISVVVGERPGIPVKPATDMVEIALRQLNADPATTAFMGDSEADGQTAKNAGLSFLAACWGFRDKEELEVYSPVLTLDHPLDLLKSWKD